MLHTWGIRGHLLGAFFGISMFAVLAAGAALYSFFVVGQTLKDVASAEIPQAIEALEISREAERMVNAAPAMLAASTPSSADQIRTSMEANARDIDARIVRLKSKGADREALSAIESALLQLRANGGELHDLITHRLQIGEARQNLRDKFRSANSSIVRVLAEEITSLDIKLEQLSLTSDQSSDVAAVMKSRAGLQAADQTVASIYGVFLEAQVSESADELSALSIRGQFALGSLNALVKGLEPDVVERLQLHTAALQKAIEGTGSIFELRKQEFGVTAKARDILVDNSWLSVDLSGAADQLVGGAKGNITDVIVRANAGQRLSTWIILTFVALCLICSTLIVWLYVGRRIVARLTELTTSMESVAGGDLKVDLPECRGDDEIDRMTKALTVFRDTAVDIEERNLRDIAQTRQQLMDAIETISEGFSLYDPDDRLVVCNSTYIRIMYPGIEDTVAPGMSFESIIRAAAERGLVANAKDRVEEWVTERLAQHRNPGAPHVQFRGNGRWILISERRIDDGGTVAVYSDITELKQREEELAGKSGALEQLSSQLAKYLSPQVYDSIFTGKQEVKVASSRKKLTIFFSDIAGFTETADRLESEELTQLLNHYLTEMSRIALRHGATIDKYVGDAILIFFGDPETRGVREDALACVQMAIEMRRRMRELEDLWRESGIEKPLHIRMGIHTGYCTVGNFGSDDRLDYTIIGGAVNIASRLEALAAPGEILISYETFAQVRDCISCEERGAVEVKGIAYPVVTYQVLDSFDSLGQAREHFREDHPKLKVDLDIAAMTADERSHAISILRQAMEFLSANTGRRQTE